MATVNIRRDVDDKFYVSVLSTRAFSIVLY